MDAQSLCPGDNPAELEALIRSYEEEYRPQGPVEDFLVDSLIHAEWSHRRWNRVKSELLANEHRPAHETAERVRKVERIIAQAAKSRARSLKHLLAVQKDRRTSQVKSAWTQAAAGGMVN